MLNRCARQPVCDSDSSGSWIEARVRVRKLSKTLAFLDAEATSAETLLLTATAIFRMF
jgi:hypothetical protein